MIQIKGYTELSYKELQKHLNKRVSDSNKTPLLIAAELNLKTINTVKNALNVDEQVVSDTVLSNVANTVLLPVVISYNCGNKYYFISSSFLKNSK